MVPAGEFIVGTLLHAGVVKPDDAELAIRIVEEELTVWLAIKNFDGEAAKTALQKGPLAKSKGTTP
jgi:hypothetical protein